MPNTDTMIALEDIENAEVRAFAEEADAFLSSKGWCREVGEGFLGLGIAGVIGIFFFRIVPSEPEVDDSVWVIVGDLPPAYLVCDVAEDWREALCGYVAEMQKWVDAAQAGQSVTDLIPVNVAPTLEHAEMLGSRLQFIREKILAVPPGTLESDT